ncbi:MAG: cytochrome o ubiquinol oxidase subunit III [Gammaproteobacteria bacterium RIFCSPHIGHO2_12_FULL_37_14]|nr:MAG: cytochrome o ubiquinol oxidase subunit III [Gammaproteobacteria bacterium RIFCSPHIGHO2_12_FULL_37_14]
MHREMTEEHQHYLESDESDVFGFWLYIMSDCILFSVLFATFIVLNMPGTGGPDLKNYIDLKYVLIETFFLLASNFVFGLAVLNLNQDKIAKVQTWLVISFLFGLCFVFLELREFINLASEGFRWDYSGKASSFFTLVGTHGLHVSCGLFWVLIMIIQLSFIRETHIVKRRMTYLGLFWNFLDIVWIFVFTVVYLVGAL